MERHEIEAFLTLADELHFGRTALRLRVSTARVSQTIRKLERRVGTTLFERTSRRVTLTPIGQELAEELRPAYALVEAALANAVKVGRGISGTLKAGFVGAATGQLLLGAADLMHSRYPDCTVRSREVQMGQAISWLRSGEIEILLGCFPIHEPDMVMGQPLIIEQQMLAVPAGHPLAHREAVFTDDLAAARVLRAPCSLVAAGAELPDAETLQEVLTLVGAGRGVFPVGAHVAHYYGRADVAYVPFHDAPLLRWGPIWLATNSSARLVAFHQVLADAAKGAIRRPAMP